jgi:hypothetical protein
MEKNFLNKRVGQVPKRIEAIEVASVVAVILVCSLACPLLLVGSSGVVAQNSQFLIGSVVNCALIMAAVRFSGKIKIASIICLPSVTAGATFVLFAVGNVFGLYMIPAIWLGNLMLVLSFKYLYVHKKWNFVNVAVVAALCKVGLIFGGYNLLLLVGVIPMGSPVAAALFTVMGVNQLITATVGAVLAFGLIKILYPTRNVML